MCQLAITEESVHRQTRTTLRWRQGKIKATRHLNLASIDIYVLLECATS